MRAVAALAAALACQAALGNEGDDLLMKVGVDGTSAPLNGVQQPVASGGKRGPKPIMSAGDSLEFPGHTIPRSFGLVPSQRAFAVADGGPWGNLNKGKWNSWFLGRAPYPGAYIVRHDGQLLKLLEFMDRQALPLGMAESGGAVADPEGAPAGRLGISFYVCNGVEVWYSTEFDATTQLVRPNDQLSHDSYLNFKLSFWESSVKPALPVFDSASRLWLPYTIADRLDEETERVIVLWVYKPNGDRWEVFTRRQMSHVTLPHTVHLDREGRIWVAGLTKWVFEDGPYGQILKPSLDPAGQYTRLDVYTLTSDKSSEAYRKEQLARWKEGNAGEPPSESAWTSVPLNFALQPVASYAIPFSFPCLWPLMVLTGDGHAIAACYDSDTVIVMRVADVVPVGAEGQEPQPPASAAAAAELRTTEPWAAPLAEGHTAVLRPTDEHQVVATLKQPRGIATIGGLHMDPTGKAFYLLDKGRKRIVSLPWPLPEAVVEAEGEEPRVLLPEGRTFKAAVPTLPS